MKAIEFLKRKGRVLSEVMEKGLPFDIRKNDNLIQDLSEFAKNVDYYEVSYDEEIKAGQKVLVLLWRAFNLCAFSSYAVYGEFVEKICIKDSNGEIKKVKLKIGKETLEQVVTVLVTETPSEKVIKHFFENNKHIPLPPNYEIYYSK